MFALPPSISGTYTLVVELEAQIDLQVGALGACTFSKGLYTYTGSALGRSQSLKTRLMRHLGDAKTMRWHVDYLLQKGRIRSIILCESERRLECLVNQALGSRTKGVVVVKRFGASDCRMGCPAHLYYQPKYRLRMLVDEVIAAYSSLTGNVHSFEFK